MNRIEQLSRDASSRLRRIERDMSTPDAWLTRLMRPARSTPGAARAALVNLLGRFRQDRR